MTATRYRVAAPLPGRILPACARCGPAGAGHLHAFRGLCIPCGYIVRTTGDVEDYPRRTVPTLILVRDACALRRQYQPVRTGGPGGGRQYGDTGMPWGEIAHLLGVTPAALEKARQRCGFPDPHTGRPIRTPARVTAPRVLEPAT